MESTKENTEELSIHTHTEYRLNIAVVTQLFTLIFNRKRKTCAEKLFCLRGLDWLEERSQLWQPSAQVSGCCNDLK